MKTFRPSIKCIVLALCLCASLLASTAWCTDRYFDEFEEKPNTLVITVLHPSLGTIRSLTGLRKEGFIPDEGILIVGSYHEDQVTDYDRSKVYVQENGLDWFRFHEIHGPLNKDNLFQTNACTPDFQTIFEHSDGIIFFGGADIPPEIYGRKTNLLTGIRTPFRHYMELSFIFHLLGGSQDDAFQPLLADHPEFPVLGICLGEQTLNVGTGGTLIQDIWYEEYGKIHLEDILKLGRQKWHNNPYPKLHPLERLLRYNMHKIKLRKEGKFVAVMGFDASDTPVIVSSHHQAVDRPGKGIRVAAVSADGRVVEAIEHAEFPNVLGTQFHPEFADLYDREGNYRFTPDDEGRTLVSVLTSNPPSYEFHRKIWAWFIENVRTFHER